MLQASPQLKDKVQSGNAAASVLRVGSWPWIHLSCSLLSKHYDMPSPKSRVRFLQGSTQLLSILPWPRIFRLWCHEVLCFWLAPLAREIGLIVMSWGSRYWWIIWPGNSFDPKPSSTVSKLNGRHWVPSSCELVIILLQYPRWTFWDHFGWSWNRMLFLIISKKGIKIH
jgi:hypothetical protein